MTKSRYLAWLVCAVAYIAAVVVGAFVYSLSESMMSDWMALLVGDIAGTLVIFLASVALNNSSLYDPYWSVAPIVIAAWLLYQAPAGANPRLLIGVSLTCIWGIRLTWNFLIGWSSLSHEDWRYRDLRESTGRAYWLVSLLGIHLFPTLLVFLGLLSLYAMTNPPYSGLGLMDYVGALVSAAAIVIEAQADSQLRDFRRTNTDPTRILDTGLWAWCRHPNYFGEMLFWWGLAIIAIGASPQHWWVFVGPVAITALFKFISLRLIDTRMVKRRPHYVEHQSRVPALFPRVPRRRQ